LKRKRAYGTDSSHALTLPYTFQSARVSSKPRLSEEGGYSSGDSSGRAGNSDAGEL